MPIHHNALGKLPTTTNRIRNYIASEELGAHSCSAHENVLRPGATVPCHKHAVEEVIVCLEGTATCSLGGGPPQEYGEGSVVIIPPGTEHTIQNTGSVILRQIAFFAGNPTGTEWIEQQGSVFDLKASG